MGGATDFDSVGSRFEPWCPFQHRAVAERFKASVCKTEDESPRRFESGLHVQFLNPGT